MLILATACTTGADASGTEVTVPTVTAIGPWSGAYDWPGPIRVEPASGSANVPVEIDMAASDSLYFHDQEGDIGDAPSWLDITTVVVMGAESGYGGDSVGVGFDLAGNLPSPIPDPNEQWIAYGLVVDVDGDGVADVRIGMANFSTTAKEHRVWRTDLATGETSHKAGPPYGAVGNFGIDSYYPFPENHRWGDGWAVIGWLPDERNFRFYIWASQIENAEIIATDFAPDQGWIDARPRGHLRQAP